MINDLVRQVEASRKLNELETGLTATGITTDCDVRFEVGSDTVRAIPRLLGDSDEEEVHGVDEPLTAAWASG